MNIQAKMKRLFFRQDYIKKYEEVNGCALGNLQWGWCNALRSMLGCADALAETGDTFAEHNAWPGGLPSMQKVNDTVIESPCRPGQLDEL